MKLLFFAVFIIAVLIVFLIISNLIRKLSYDIKERYLHFRFILIVIISELAVFNYYTTSGIMNFIDKIIKIPFVANILNFILPNRAYEIIYMLLMIIGLNAVFAIITFVAMAIIKIVFKNKQAYFLEDEEYIGAKILLYVPHKIVSFFYKYDDEEEDFTLASKFFSYGIWAKFIKWIPAVIFAILIIVMGVSVCWGTEQWNLTLRQLSKAFYWVPFAAFVLVQQLELFFSAEIKAVAGSYSTTAINGELIMETEHVVELYKKTFEKSKVLITAEKVDTLFDHDDSLYSDLSNRQIEDCVQSDVLEIIVKQLDECKVKHSADYKDAVAALLNRRSINVRDRVDGEILIYITAYVNYVMSQGKNILLLCKDEEEAERLKTVFRESMRRLNNIGDIWNICTLEEAEKDKPMNFLVCSFDGLIFSRILEKRRSFQKAVDCVIVTSGLFLFSQDEIKIERLFNSIRSGEKELQYILITDVDNDSVRSAMENATKTELSLFKNDFCKENTHLMLWREESVHKIQCSLGIGKERSPYMGVSMPLALVASKYDFLGVILVPSDTRPYQTYFQSMVMNSQEVFRYLGKNIEINSVIKKDAVDIYGEENIKIIIVYDTDYNFYNAIWRWVKYGGEKGTIFHVISPDYILREYFADNIRKENFLFKNNEYDALIPTGLAMKFSHLVVLLVDLHDKGMTESEIMKKSREYGWLYEKPEEVLGACLAAVLEKEENYGVFDVFDFKPVKLYVKSEDKIVNEAFVTLKEENIYRRILSKSKKAVLCINNDQLFELPILKGNVNNYYLRDQILNFKGCAYKINSITEGVIYASQCNDHYVYNYYPVSEFSFKNYKIEDSCVDSTYIDFNIATALVKRRIPAYWRSNNGNKVLNEGIFVVNDLCDKNIEEEKEVTVLEINFSKGDFEGDFKKAITAFCYILGELFKTLFPDVWQNLYAVMPCDNGIDVKSIIDNGTEGKLEDIVRSMIPFTTEKPTANEGFETVYIVEYSCVEYGLVDHLYNNRESILMMVREYLEWYLQEDVISEVSEADGFVLSDDTEKNNGKTRGTYLHFGGSKIPEIFDLSLLYKLLKNITGETPQENTGVVESIEVELPNVCSFCGKNTMVVKKLKDGRLMCTHCSEHQIDEREQVEHLCEDIINHFEEDYSIKFKRKIKVSYKSADEILKTVGGTTVGRVLGFYAPAERILWIEARGPRTAMQSTVTHELTHAWQFDNLPIKKLKRCKALKMLFPDKSRDEAVKIILEGHAVYNEIKTMREFNNYNFAERMHKNMLLSTDEYGIGYKLLYDYFESAQGEGSHMNPFTIMQRFVDDIITGKIEGR